MTNTNLFKYIIYIPTSNNVFVLLYIRIYRSICAYVQTTKNRCKNSAANSPHTYETKQAQFHAGNGDNSDICNFKRYWNNCLRYKLTLSSTNAGRGHNRMGVKTNIKTLLHSRMVFQIETSPNAIIRNCETLLFVRLYKQELIACHVTANSEQEIVWLAHEKLIWHHSGTFSIISGDSNNFG